MSEHPSRPTPGVPDEWRSDLVLALRARDVSGRRIGEVLAEVEEFCAESGQDASTAFGPPHEYAAQVTGADPATARTGLLSGLGSVPGLLGMLLVLASAGDARVSLTVGMVAATAVWLLAATAIVQLVLRPQVRHARSAVGLGLLAWVACAGGVALLLVLDQPFVTLPRPVALAIGGALVVGPAVVGTLRAHRSPTVDLVSSPWDDPEDVRRRNLRADLWAAWVLPIGTVLGYGLVGLVTTLAPG